MKPLASAPTARGVTTGVDAPRRVPACLPRCSQPAGNQQAPTLRRLCSSDRGRRPAHCATPRAMPLTSVDGGGGDALPGLENVEDHALPALWRGSVSRRLALPETAGGGERVGNRSRLITFQVQTRSQAGSPVVIVVAGGAGRAADGLVSTVDAGFGGLAAALRPNRHLRPAKRAGSALQGALRAAASGRQRHAGARCPTCSQAPQLLPPGRHWLYHSCRRWQVEPGGQDWPGKRASAQVYCAQLPPLPPHWSHSCRVEPEPWMHCQYHSPARPRAGGVASGPE